MTQQPRIKLNDGNSIPQVGLGVWQTRTTKQRQP